MTQHPHVPGVYPPGVDGHCRACGFFFYTGMPTTHASDCKYRAAMPVQRAPRYGALWLVHDLPNGTRWFTTAFGHVGRPMLVLGPCTESDAWVTLRELGTRTRP